MTAALAQMKKRTALAWLPELPTKNMKTYWGGYPNWPKDEPWPMRGDQECMFLAQFDLTDLPWRPKGVPDSGTLYLFYDPMTEMSYGKPTDLCSVYYASAGRDCVETRPSRPITDPELLIYDYGLNVRDGKSLRAWVKYDALPQFALKMASFTDYWHGAFPNCPDWEFSKQVKDRRQNSMLSALQEGGFTSASKDEVSKWVGSSANLIDPNGLRLGLERVAVPDHQEDDPRAQAWPLTTGHILYHATRILETRRDNSEFLLNTTSTVSSLRQDAKEWAEWARSQGNIPVSRKDRDAYIGWCRKAFSIAIARWKRITPFDLTTDRWATKNLGLSRLLGRARKPLQPETERYYEYGALNDILTGMFRFHSPFTDYGLLTLPTNYFEGLPAWAAKKYRTLYAPGQLFGYGHDEQGNDIGPHTNHLFLTEIHSGGGVACGDGYKVWLHEPIQTDAWQKVVVENPA